MWTDANERIDQARNYILSIAAGVMPEEPFSLEDKNDLQKLRSRLQKALSAVDSLIKTGDISHANHR